MAIEKKIKIVVDADEANQALEDVNQNLDDGTEATDQMTGALDGMTGGALTGFKKMLGGIKTAIRGFKSLRVAIISTGIGALVIAIGSLIAYFTSSEEGANKLKVAFAAVGAVVDKLVEGFAKVGKFLAKVGGIIKDVVKGDKSLREGWNETKVAAVEMKDELVKAYKEIGTVAGKAMDLQRRENQLRIDQRKNLVEEARLLVELSNARLKTDNQLLTTQQRIEALNEAERLNNAIYDEKIRQKKEEYEIQKQRNALADSTSDDLLKEAELQAELINLEAERNTRFKEQSDKRSGLLKQAEAARAAELQAKNDAIDAEILADIKAYEAKEALRKKEEEDRKKAAEFEKQLALEVRNAKLGIAAQTSILIAQMVNKDSLAYKGLAIAQTTISGIQGAQNAFTTASKSPIAEFFPAYPFIQAGLAGGFAIAQIANIAKVNPSGKGSTGSPRVSSGGGSRTSSPQFNVVSGTGTNQIAESINSNKAPIKAYVIGSEVSSQQELDRKTQANASL